MDLWSLLAGPPQTLYLCAAHRRNSQCRHTLTESQIKQAFLTIPAMAGALVFPAEKPTFLLGGEPAFLIT